MTDETAGRDALVERFSVDVDAYAECNAPLLAAAAQPLLDALDLSSADRILDLGTGTGSMLRSLREQAPQAAVLGTDLVTAMLRRARLDTGSPVAAMDVTRLGVVDGAADIALSAFVLRFLPDPNAALREQRRVLRPGGVAGVVVWGQMEDAAHEVLLDEVLDELGAAPYVNRYVLTDDQLDEPGKLRAAMLEVGFAEPRTWGGDYVWSFTARSFLDFAPRGLDHFRQRFASLDGEMRSRVLAVAEDRLTAAGLATGSDRSVVVYGVAAA